MDENVKQNFNGVRQRIINAANSCGRAPGSIQLVAVSKTMESDRVRQAVMAGATCLGENYIQEAKDKIRELEDLNVAWHFIGHLQSNKAKFAVRLFSMIHSVDSLKLAKELNKYAEKIGKVQDILMQVNLSGEKTKSGETEKNALSLAQKISLLKNIHLCGLMTMPPFFNDPVKARPYFIQLRELRNTIASQNIPGVDLKELSMGMTGDFEEAINQGATMIRVGTAIFGPRLFSKPGQ